ncbi:MAG: hypothetical protein R2773_03435 [Flavobacteriaceae bacterium]
MDGRSELLETFSSKLGAPWMNKKVGDDVSGVMDSFRLPTTFKETLAQKRHIIFVSFLVVKSIPNW